MMKSVTTPLLFIALAACSAGGAGNTPADRIEDASRLTVANIQSEARALQRQFRGATPTRYAALPDTGSATYDGLVGGTFSASGDSTDFVGRAAIDVDFADGAVDGQLGKFFTAERERLSGTLSLRDGRVTSNRLDPFTTIRSGVRGRLTTPDGETIRVNADLEGGFLNGTDGIGGDIRGRAVVGDTGGRINAGLLLSDN